MGFGYGIALAVLAPALALSGCSGVTPVLAPHIPVETRRTAIDLDATPCYPQTVHQCGPAALATALQASGVDITPGDLVSRVYLPDRQGSLQTELVAATRGYARLPYLIAPNLTTLLAELQADHPVLVLQNLGFSFYPLWHYAVVIGYLPEDDAVILRSGVTCRLVMPAGRFLRTWRLAGYWGLVVLRPGELPARPASATYLRAAADLEAVGQTQAAALAYGAAVTRWPNDATAWLGLGNTQYQSGRLPAAEDSYRQAVRADPGYLAAWNNLAEVLAERGCINAAITILDNALTRPGSTNALRELLRQTRSEILSRRSAGHSADAPACGQAD
ncbi:MAG: PA2778 family cysteine peptidase [Gammaproteobacteria bacterium]